MNYDFDAILRQIKPEKQTGQVEPGSCVDFDDIGVRAAVVLDTNVYIDMAAGRVDLAARAKLATCLQHHSAVALAELAQGVAAYGPSKSDYAAVRRHYTDLLRAVPRSRLLVPDADTWLRAGVVAGLLSRTQNFQPHERKKMMADALIYLDAARHGLPVLTRNVRDLALIATVHGGGRVIRF